MSAKAELNTSIGLTSEFHGAGTSTTAKLLSLMLGLPYHSTSVLVRRYAKYYFGSESDSSEEQLKLAAPFIAINPNFEARVDRRAIRVATAEDSIFEGKAAVDLAKSGKIPRRDGELTDIGGDQRIFSIQLTCSEEESALRALTREWAIANEINLKGLSENEIQELRKRFTEEQIAEMSAKLTNRMEKNRQRWKVTYPDLETNYDLVVDTTRNKPEEVAKRIIIELVKIGIINPENYQNYVPLLIDVIPGFDEDERLTPAIRQLRESAPIAIGWLLQHSLIADLDLLEISILGANESVRSACYTLIFDKHGEQEDLVSKLTPNNPRLDLLALQHWQEAGVIVPKIVDSGRVDSPLLKDMEMYFILMSKISKKDMSAASDGYPFIDELYKTDKNRITFFGEQAGKILSRMVSSPTNEKFQGPDFEESTNFPEMISKFREKHRNELDSMGISSQKLDRFIQLLFEDLSEVGAFLVHNDFAPHNLLVTDKESIDLALIDPNAIVADKYWDLATAKNRLQWLELQLASDQSNESYQYKLEREKLYYSGLEAGFFRDGQQEIDHRHFVLVRIAQAMWKICKTQSEDPCSLGESLQKIHQFRIFAFNDLLEELE